MNARPRLTLDQRIEKRLAQVQSALPPTDTRYVMPGGTVVRDSWRCEREAASNAQRVADLHPDWQVWCGSQRVLPEVETVTSA